MALLTLGILIIFLLVVIMIGTPIAFALGFIAVAGMLLLLSPTHFIQIGNIVYSQGTSINQFIAPLFLLMAEFLSQGGIASDLYGVISRWTRKFKAGIGISAVIAATVFAALSGSSVATAAAIGRTSIKEMLRRGWDERLAVGLVAAAGTTGIMIPPSIGLVIYGIITETSITRLFMAGVLPGLMDSFIVCTYLIIRAKLNPKLVGVGVNKTDEASQVSGDVTNEIAVTTETRPSLLNDFSALFPPLALIFAVLGSLYMGWASPTEIAGVGAMGSLILVALKGRLNRRMLNGALKDASKNSSMILLLVFAGISLSYLVSYLGVPQEIARIVTGTIQNKWAVLIGVYIIWILMGMVIDPMSMIVLTIPFIFPTLLAYGFDPIWLGIVSTLCMEIAMITPPVGMNLFVLGSVTDTNMKDIIMGSLPFVFLLILNLIILTVFPQIALFLPSRVR